MVAGLSLNRVLCGMCKQWIEDPGIKFNRFSQNLIPFKIYVVAVYAD